MGGDAVDADDRGGRTMTEQLQKKIQQSIKLLQTTCGGKENVELAYSGGKDSDVILQLAKEAGIKFTPRYKNTTIDPPETIKHCKDNGVEILQPKESFFEIVKKAGYPNRFHRLCCARLKEYPTECITVAWFIPYALPTLFVEYRHSSTRK